MRISDWSSDVCSSDLPGLPGFILGHEAKYRVNIHIGCINMLGSTQRAGVYPAVIDGPAQFDFDPLPRESNEIGNTFQRAIHTGRADLQAFVIDIFDVKNARQLTRNQFAVFDPDPLGP